MPYSGSLRPQSCEWHLYVRKNNCVWVCTVIFIIMTSAFLVIRFTHSLSLKIGINLDNVIILSSFLQKTHPVFITKTVIFTEVMHMYCRNHMKYMNTLCGKMWSFCCSRWYVYSPLGFIREPLSFQRVHNWHLFQISEHVSGTFLQNVGHYPSKITASRHRRLASPETRLCVYCTTRTCIVLVMPVCLSARMFQFKKQWMTSDEI
jgi:hypothetical protein